MCGICGKFFKSGQDVVSPELVDRMVATLSHRGPDGRGKYLSGPIGLGHARLSIIDLTTGAQPISNEDNTIWLVYNGEIYNFPDLRLQLIKKGHVFRSATDTEVIVHLYEEYGVECLSRLRGMFAFALWDQNRRSLFIARDRVGIKPLYYVDRGGVFVFGSEIKSILADPQVRREVNAQSIDKFLTCLHLPGSDTLFRDIRKLEPGHYLVINGNETICRQYWDLRFAPSNVWRSIEEAAEALVGLLKETVRDHMISDVPVGVLLSGGVDSSAVLSCAVEETAKTIQTFTIGFNGNDFEDERKYARLVANQFKTDHRDITITPGEFSCFLPDYIWHMEEPVCEAPAIALHYVSKLASQYVKVVLSGEGGDEAFGGYQNYRNLLLLEKIKSALGPLKIPLSSLVQAIGALSGSPRFQKYGPLIKAPLETYYYSRVSSPFSYFRKNRQQLYSGAFLGGLDEDQTARHIAALFERANGIGVLNQMLYIDSKTWLPDDLLIKADRISMANSLELRVPLLDHQVLEFAASLPPDYKVKGLATKRVLKRAFSNRLPEVVLTRRKAGLPVPIARWMRSDLSAYVREHLLSSRSLGRGYFNRYAIERLLAQCAAGQPVAKEVFSLLALELWHIRFMDQAIS